MENIDKEIKLINSIVEEAIMHGGDKGGPYFCNLDKLQEAINEWLKFKNFNNRYKIIEQVPLEFNYNTWDDYRKDYEKYSFCSILKLRKED